MAQGVGMDFFRLRPARWAASLARVPNVFAVDRADSLVCQRLPGKSQSLGFRRKRRQCSRSSSSNLGLSITSRSLRPFAALDVNHHALAVDVADFQVCQLSAPQLR